MHLQNYTFSRWFAVFIFIFIFTIFFHNHRDTTQSSTNGTDDASHPWLNSLSLEIVQVLRCKCARIEHCIVFCLSVFYLFFSFSFANCEMDKWTHSYTHLECTNEHRTKIHLFIVVILSMNNNKKTIPTTWIPAAAHTLHMEFLTMLLDYVIYELENLNTRFWRYSIFFQPSESNS